MTAPTTSPVSGAATQVLQHARATAAARHQHAGAGHLLEQLLDDPASEELRLWREHGGRPPHEVVGWATTPVSTAVLGPEQPRLDLVVNEAGSGAIDPRDASIGLPDLFGALASLPGAHRAFFPADLDRFCSALRVSVGSGDPDDLAALGRPGGGTTPEDRPPGAYGPARQGHLTGRILVGWLLRFTAFAGFAGAALVSFPGVLVRMGLERLVGLPFGVSAGYGRFYPKVTPTRHLAGSPSAGRRLATVAIPLLATFSLGVALLFPGVYEMRVLGSLALGGYDGTFGSVGRALVDESMFLALLLAADREPRYDVYLACACLFASFPRRADVEVLMDAVAGHRALARWCRRLLLPVRCVNLTDEGLAAIGLPMTLGAGLAGVISGLLVCVVIVAITS